MAAHSKTHARPSRNRAIRGGWWLAALACWPIQYLVYVPVQCGSRLIQTGQPGGGRFGPKEVDDPITLSNSYTPRPRHDYLGSWPELRPWFIDHLRAVPDG